jgi:hypothetical protein
MRLELACLAWVQERYSGESLRTEQKRAIIGATVASGGAFLNGQKGTAIPFCLAKSGQHTRETASARDIVCRRDCDSSMTNLPTSFVDKLAAWQICQGGIS